MKVVDELITPGCPQCAIKHLSAALYHAARGNINLTNLTGLADCERMMANVLVGIAIINLAEVRSGYASHLWFAVGALVRAEEIYAADRLGVPLVVRDVRLLLEQKGESAVSEAILTLSHAVYLTPLEWLYAHYEEAVRELPREAHYIDVKDPVKSIRHIREEYFNLPPSTVPVEGDEKQNRKGADHGNREEDAR